jgi:hypothetical protein
MSPEELSASLARDVGNLRTGSRLIVTSLSGTGLTNKQLAGIMEPVPHNILYRESIAVVKIRRMIF